MSSSDDGFYPGQPTNRPPVKSKSKSMRMKRTSRTPELDVLDRSDVSITPADASNAATRANTKKDKKGGSSRRHRTLRASFETPRIPLDAIDRRQHARDSKSMHDMDRPKSSRVRLLSTRSPPKAKMRALHHNHTKDAKKLDKHGKTRSAWSIPSPRKKGKDKGVSLTTDEEQHPGVKRLQDTRDIFVQLQRITQRYVWALQQTRSIGEEMCTLYTKASQMMHSSSSSRAQEGAEAHAAIESAVRACGAWNGCVDGVASAMQELVERPIARMMEEERTILESVACGRAATKATLNTSLEQAAVNGNSMGTEDLSNLLVDARDHWVMHERGEAVAHQRVAALEAMRVSVLLCGACGAAEGLHDEAERLSLLILKESVNGRWEAAMKHAKSKAKAAEASVDVKGVGGQDKCADGSGGGNGGERAMEVDDGVDRRSGGGDPPVASPRRKGRERIDDAASHAAIRQMRRNKARRRKRQQVRMMLEEQSKEEMKSQRKEKIDEDVVNKDEDVGNKDEDVGKNGEDVAENGSDMVRAVASWKSREDDELSFTHGDVLSVISKASEDWWVCEIKGVRGLAPASYLRLVDE